MYDKALSNWVKFKMLKTVIYKLDQALVFPLVLINHAD